MEKEATILLVMIVDEEAMKNIKVVDEAPTEIAQPAAIFQSTRILIVENVKNCV